MRWYGLLIAAVVGAFMWWLIALALEAAAHALTV